MEHELYLLQNIWILIILHPYAFKNTYCAVSECPKIIKWWGFSSAHISVTFVVVSLCSHKGQQCVYQIGR